ncbi:hypothetical protein WJR50_26780 [Catalinimonas sp. 4WD22]
MTFHYDALIRSSEYPKISNYYTPKRDLTAERVTQQVMRDAIKKFDPEP